MSTADKLLVKSNRSVLAQTALGTLTSLAATRAAALSVGVATIRLAQVRPNEIPASVLAVKPAVKENFQRPKKIGMVIYSNDSETGWNAFAWETLPLKRVRL